MPDEQLSHLDRLLGTNIQLVGNTGKIHTLCELSRLISTTPGLSILDIGCVGPYPLDFWRPLFALYDGEFNLTGIDKDAAGIENTRHLVHEFTQHPVTLQPGNGYDLARLFPGQQFDVIVFTQVLEHVFHYRDFLAAVQQAVKPGGHVLFTLDSGHYPRTGRTLKDSVKGILARLEREGHYEHGWRDNELDPILTGLHFDIIEKSYYCTAPHKKIHNHHLAPEMKNAFMRMWYAQEQFLNMHLSFIEANKRLFLILYYHLTRRA